MTDEEEVNRFRRQLATREHRRSIRKVLPTDREVLLAELLIEVCQHLDWADKAEGGLYDRVKHIAEDVVRGA